MYCVDYDRAWGVINAQCLKTVSDVHSETIKCTPIQNYVQKYS